jgi:hypothetical protein
MLMNTTARQKCKTVKPPKLSKKLDCYAPPPPMVLPYDPLTVMGQIVVRAVIGETKPATFRREIVSGRIWFHYDDSKQLIGVEVAPVQGEPQCQTS